MSTTSIELTGTEQDQFPGNFVEVLEHTFRFSLDQEVRRQHAIVRSFLLRAGPNSYKETWQQQRYVNLIGWDLVRVLDPFTHLPTGFSGWISEEVAGNVSLFRVIIYTNEQEVADKIRSVIDQLTTGCVYTSAERLINPMLLKRFSVKRSSSNKTNNSGDITGSVSVRSEIEDTPQRNIVVNLRRATVSYTVNLPDHITSIDALLRALCSQYNVSIPERYVVLARGPDGEPTLISSVPVGDGKVSILSAEEFEKFRHAREEMERIENEKYIAFGQADEMRRKADEMRRKADEMRHKADEMRHKAERKAQEELRVISRDLKW